MVRLFAALTLPPDAAETLAHYRHHHTHSHDDCGHAHGRSGDHRHGAAPDA